jgi:hypothetical protein
MPKVIITKNKISGLATGAITQDQDGVNLDLYNQLAVVVQDLSAYAYTISGGTADVSGIKQDLDNLENFIYNDFYPQFTDLSTNLYDLSGVVYDISGTVNDLSSNYYNFYPQFVDLSAYVYDLSGGGGGTTSTDISALLFDPPPSASNGSYTSTQSQINLNWNPPIQTKAAFNFVSNPDTTGNNNPYNYLPFINDFEFGYKRSDLTTYTTITSFTGTYIPININSAEIINTGSSITATITGGNKLELDLTTSAIGQAYNFRLAYKNNSSDVDWKYLYIPDNSSSFIGFGQPGPANPPDTATTPLSFSSTSYNNLTLNGFGAIPSLGMDSSLNIPYGSSILAVGYGVDISGSKRNNYLQIGGETQSYSIGDLSAGYPVNPSYNTQSWNRNLNSIAYPEYEYNTQANTYYAINSSQDFSNVKVYGSVGQIDGYVRIPRRSDVTTVYDEDLSAKTFNPVIQESINSTTAIKRIDYSTVSNIYFLGDASNISFKDTGNLPYKLLANYGNGKVTPSVNDFVETNSILGIDTSGTNLSYILLEASGNNILYNAQSPYRIGWSNNPLNVGNTVTTAYFNLGVSKTIDVSNIADITRTEGYYLGFDVTNVLLQNVNLTSFPDICNNNYDPYYFKFKQVVDLSDGSQLTYQPSGTNTFNVAKIPEEDTFLSDVTLSIHNPTLSSGNSKFFGLLLPTGSSSSDELTFTVDFSINNLNPTWAPLDAVSNNKSLYDVSLVYNPLGESINLPVTTNKISVDQQTSNWQPSLTARNYQVSETLIVDYQGTNQDDYYKFPFSRDISGAGKQFGVGVQIGNNLLKANVISDGYSRINDLSGNGESWWWDFTFNIGGPFPQVGSTNFPSDFITVTGETIAQIELTELVNVFDSSINQPALSGFDMTNSINYYTSMWAKEGFCGDGSNNFISNSVNPYIDYNQFYGQSEDYSTLDSSGINQIVEYSSLSYYTGIAKTFDYKNTKWFILKLTNNNTTGGKTMNFSITDLTIGEDYVLFYQEEQISKIGTAGYTWNTGGLQYFSPWLDCANKSNPPASALGTFIEGQNATIKGQYNGNYNSSKVSYPIIRWVTNKAVYQYLAIGIQPGKIVKEINISFG